MVPRQDSNPRPINRKSDALPIVPLSHATLGSADEHLMYKKRQINCSWLHTVFIMSMSIYHRKYVHKIPIHLFLNKKYES